VEAHGSMGEAHFSASKRPAMKRNNKKPFFRSQNFNCKTKEKLKKTEILCYKNTAKKNF
jgi:hypothetical protein